MNKNFVVEYCTHVTWSLERTYVPGYEVGFEELKELNAALKGHAVKLTVVYPGNGEYNYRTGIWTGWEKDQEAHDDDLRSIAKTLHGFRDTHGQFIKIWPTEVELIPGKVKFDVENVVKRLPDSYGVVKELRQSRNRHVSLPPKYTIYPPTKEVRDIVNLKVTTPQSFYRTGLSLGQYIEQTTVEITAGDKSAEIADWTIYDKIVQEEERKAQKNADEGFADYFNSASEDGGKTAVIKFAVSVRGSWSEGYRQEFPLPERYVKLYQYGAGTNIWLVLDKEAAQRAGKITINVREKDKGAFIGRKGSNIRAQEERIGARIKVK